MPNWPISVGSAPPAAAGAAAGFASGLAAAGLAGAGFDLASFAGPCACAWVETPPSSMPAAKIVSIPLIDMAIRSPIIVTARWPGTTAVCNQLSVMAGLVPAIQG